jgi:hypothetical protein
MQLRHQARALWRDQALQRKWLRAVALTRATKQGWVLDTRVEKKA